MSRFFLSSRGRFALGAAVIAFVALGLWALLGLKNDRTTLEATVDWMTDRAGCAAVVRHEQRLPFRPAVQPGVHADFDNHADRYMSLDCEHFGGEVTFEQFASTAVLHRALERSQSIRRANLCVNGKVVVHADLLAHGGATSALCRYVQGRFRRRPDPPCHFPPDTVSSKRIRRISALEDAGGRCVYGARPASR